MLRNMLKICSHKGPSVLSNNIALGILKRTKTNLAGKNVILAGGVNGLAYKTAEVLLSKNVSRLGFIGLRQHPKLVNLAKEFPNTKIVYCKTDVTDENRMVNSVDQVVKKFNGCLDIFINFMPHVHEQDHIHSIKMTLLGTIYGTLCALNYMDKTKGGKGGLIVNVSSIFGLEPCGPIATYSASMHGILGWTRSMAEQCYCNGTCVELVAVCPCMTLADKFYMKRETTYPGCEKYVKKLAAVPTKTNIEYACDIIKAIEESKNGSIWIFDEKEREVEPTKYWSLA